MSHKTSLDKFQRIQVIKNIFPIHNGMKLHITGAGGNLENPLIYGKKITRFYITHGSKNLKGKFESILNQIKMKT